MHAIARNVKSIFRGNISFFPWQYSRSDPLVRPRLGGGGPPRICAPLAACQEKHDAVEKGEVGELLPSMALTQRERERERPTHTTLTYSHAQPKGGEEKKEDKKTGTRAKSKCSGTARGGCDSFAGRSLPRQQGRGEGMEAPSPLPVDQVCAKGVCVSV